MNFDQRRDTKRSPSEWPTGSAGRKIAGADLWRPVREILRRRSLAALPQRDVFVVEDHRAAARRDLGKSIRQHGSD
jgi:hypothetical protein